MNWEELEQRARTEPDLDIARGLYYCAKMKKCPYSSDGRYYICNPQNESFFSTNGVDQKTWDYLDKVQTMNHWKGWSTLDQAYKALGKALLESGWWGEQCK